MTIVWMYSGRCTDTAPRYIVSYLYGRDAITGRISRLFTSRGNQRAGDSKPNPTRTRLKVLAVNGLQTYRPAHTTGDSGVESIEESRDKRSTNLFLTDVAPA